MITIYVDNVPYHVKEDQNLLAACLSIGFNVPYFCWHPALHSVGACRQCAVKVFRDERDTRGRVVMSCMTAATDGLRCSIDDPEAKSFRAGVIEWLMLNHPHDCPICDEGGECHLQDMTVLTGHVYRRTRFKKRTHLNQNLGPFLNHEMNRCIECYRCVRFYRDYAGGRDFNVFSIHDNVYFGRFEDGALESPFAGNLVEICPTGVFTDKTFKQHPTRKWDLQTAPSICAQCSLGCNTIVGERYGKVRRVLNRYNSEVNRYFLCDRGRYGYDFVNSPRRLRLPAVAGRDLIPDGAAPSGTGLDLSVTEGGEPRAPGATPEAKRAVVKQAVDYVREVLSKSRRTIGIGSATASLESNFALRSLVGVQNFCDGMSEHNHLLMKTAAEILKRGPAKCLSLAEVEKADVVLVLGEDVGNIAPLVELSLRQTVRNRPELVVGETLDIPNWDDRAVREAVQGKKAPLFVATPYPVSIDEIAVRSFRGAPDEIARLGFAIANAVSPHNAPEVPGLDERIHVFAETIAGSLSLASRPVIVAGTSLRNESVLKAAANVAAALCDVGKKDVGLFLITPEANSTGVALYEGMGIHQAVAEVERGAADTVIIMENDLARRLDPDSFRILFEKAEHTIVLDYLRNPTTENAEVVLPTATSPESSGTIVNNEGRAQRFYAAVNPDEIINASWKWLNLIGNPHYDGTIVWDSLDSIVEAIAKQVPALQPIRSLAPLAHEVKPGLKVPRQSHRASGRTASTAFLSVHEPRPPVDLDSPLSFSMEGEADRARIPSPLISRLWAPHWNSVQALSRFEEEVDGPLRGGDPGVRLFEPELQAVPVYYEDIPEWLEPEPGMLFVVPHHHVFGSERTSSFSPAVAQRIPVRYVAISPKTAEELGAVEGQRIELEIDKVHTELPVKIVAGMAEGVCAIPFGLPDMEGYSAVPTWGRLSVGAKAGV